MHLISITFTVFLATIVSANYAPAHYDSIVKSSVIPTPILKTEKSLVLHKPVLITSLAPKPATIIKKVYPAAIEEPCDVPLVKTVAVQPQPIINVLPAPQISQPVSYGYSYSVVNKPEVRKIALPHHDHIDIAKIETPTIAYGLPREEHASFVPVKPVLEYGAPHEEPATFVPVKPALEYGVPVEEHIDYAPPARPAAFGYSFSVYPSPQVAVAHHVPEEHHVITPAAEYGPPREVAKVTFAPHQQLPIAGRYSPFSLSQFYKQY